MVTTTAAGSLSLFFSLPAVLTAVAAAAATHSQTTADADAATTTAATTADAAADFYRIISGRSFPPAFYCMQIGRVFCQLCNFSNYRYKDKSKIIEKFSF